jgi:hypothetical protein
VRVTTKAPCMLAGIVAKVSRRDRAHGGEVVGAERLLTGSGVTRAVRGRPRGSVAIAISISLCFAAASLAACSGSASESPQATTSQSAQAAAIAKIVQSAMKTYHLKAAA